MNPDDEKLIITLIWGITIGSLIILMDTFFGVLYWRSGNTLFGFQPAPLVGLLIIGLFSYAYLRSMLLGVMCGVACAVPFFFHLLFQSPVFISISGFIISAMFYSLAGAIGGYLAEKKNRPLYIFKVKIFSSSLLSDLTLTSYFPHAFSSQLHM